MAYTGLLFLMFLSLVVQEILALTLVMLLFILKPYDHGTVHAGKPLHTFFVLYSLTCQKTLEIPTIPVYSALATS